MKEQLANTGKLVELQFSSSLTFKKKSISLSKVKRIQNKAKINNSSLVNHDWAFYFVGRLCHSV
ncbi:hypothetical protein JCM15457_1432 [Liquorilactobacillus sucicola DSM 21376 = JCM 15457]|uniref:Uncharacterized protein n=1 Tax=Liquorilactobacillus sucicola DSM 21376 = JCM 15457 TaxID=1423806 RepID=A0A023CXA0_9LACO|nr:hypothetical protein FD15_GL000578 [Liquorilactobacillus sucicola DSM 21376 = JCM 15457]GAJ26502.1 hypothetical protein JCM15457_1432 [Liquorilactobacillus sucicola DSM 21376 = JCM 15457]